MIVIGYIDVDDISIVNSSINYNDGDDVIIAGGGFRMTM